MGIVHVDVMDGCFCPQMTVGAPYVKGLRTPLLKDVHLMIHEPLDKLAAFVAAGADIITVHVEAAVHIHRVLQRYGRHGAQRRTRPGDRARARPEPRDSSGMADAALAARGGDDLAPGGRSGLERAEVRSHHL